MSLSESKQVCGPAKTLEDCHKPLSMGKCESHYKEVKVEILTFSKQGPDSDVTGSGVTPKFIPSL